jgi:hypothetical protein
MSKTIRAKLIAISKTFAFGGFCVICFAPEMIESRRFALFCGLVAFIAFVLLQTLADKTLFVWGMLVVGICGIIVLTEKLFGIVLPPKINSVIYTLAFGILIILGCSALIKKLLAFIRARKKAND